MTGHDFDVAIVGGSFAGLSAALPLARARRRVLLIDGGMPRNRFAAASHNFLNHDGLPPAEITRSGRDELTRYPTARVRRTGVADARADGDRFVLTLDEGGAVRAARLVLATGVADRLPDLPGLAERWGRSVVHCPYCHGYEFGGGPLGVLITDPAITHQAILVTDWGPVTVFTGGADLPEDVVRTLTDRGAKIEPVPVVALDGPLPSLTGARLADGRHVPLTGLFLPPAPHLTGDLHERLGCRTTEGAAGPAIETDGMGATSVTGVFAAGDAAGGMPSAAIAAASGLLAGTAAHKSLVF